MRPVTLRCEYKDNPLGLDNPQPRFDWKFEIDPCRRGSFQTAYQIGASTTFNRVEQQIFDLWDSGKVVSDRSNQVKWGGDHLASRQRVYWTVRVWDEAGEQSEWADPQSFEMGLLEQSDWDGAEWIGASLALGGKWTTAPCPYLRKHFDLTAPVRSARLYVTALGLYEPYINGSRVSPDRFTPGSTDYNKRIQYLAYDVTSQLAIGINCVGVILGDGWYCGHNQMLGRQTYGNAPRLLVRLEILLENGKTEYILSDDSWTWTTGPLLESDMLMGESYDARQELGDWSSPASDKGVWIPVATFAGARHAGSKITASPGPQVRPQEELIPIAPPKESKPGHWVFDLGQNMVGVVRLRIKGPVGTTITIRHTEMLQPNGEIYTENLRSALQTDRYTLKGDPNGELYEPRFTFKGFRYVELTGLPEPPSIETVTGIVLHSDMLQTGTFDCSNPLISQLQKNINWGQKGNFVDIPTDCPQRDERLGWTGDAQVFIRTAAFNRDVAGFFTKWLRDLEDGQTAAGAYTMVAPTAPNTAHDGGPAWADAGLICPWTIFLVYGDTKVLSEHYASMCRFVDYLVESSPGLIRSDPALGWGGFGDWLSIKADTPPELIGTAFFAYSARLLSRCAAILGEAEDSEKYLGLSERVKSAFIEKFVTPGGLLSGQTQTSYVLALQFDLLPDHLRPKSADALEKDIVARGTHLSTGFVGTPYLLHALSSAGKTALAYKLLNQTSFPSWLYPVTQGATTIWERWDGWTEDKGFQDIGMNSFNHYAYGAVGDWMYRVVAGIDIQRDEDGYKKLHLAPKPGGGLTWVRASFESPYGNIVSAWNFNSADRLFEWEVTVPPNTDAIVEIPASDTNSVTESGIALDLANGISNVRLSPAGSVSFDLRPGSYSFKTSSAIEPN